MSLVPVARLACPAGKNEAPEAPTFSSGRSYFSFPKNRACCQKDGGLSAAGQAISFAARDPAGCGGGGSCGDRLLQLVPQPCSNSSLARRPPRWEGENPSSHLRLGGLRLPRNREEILELLFVFLNLKIDSGEESEGVV